MATPNSGFYFKEGHIIDVLETNWKIEIDDASDSVLFYHEVEDHSFVFNGDGSFEVPTTYDFSNADIDFKGVSVEDAPEVAQDVIRQTDAENSLSQVGFEGLTSDPTLQSGMIWYRSDKDQIRVSQDGSNVSTLGWDV